jgi:polyribonucleotide nucleotidyltransferase
MSSTFSRVIGSETLTIETGKLAQQANGSVLLRYGECVILATVTMSKPREGIDFFPLTVEFEERLYARGKIPGSFFRREGRPSSHGTLIARLTDRPIRPLFPEGFKNEVQVVITPLSIEMEVPLETLCVVAGSSALSISDIPFEGPIAATRIGCVNGNLVASPTYSQLEESTLDLIVAGSGQGVIMMEAGGNEASEDLVLDAIQQAQDFNLEVIGLQEEMVRSIGKAKASYPVDSPPEGLAERVADVLDGKVASAFGSSDGKADLAIKLDGLKAELSEKLGDEFESKPLANAFDAQVEKEFRTQLLYEGKRPDSRGLREIRPISCEVAMLPRTHGTGLFSRGETQILCVATLGSVGDAQKMDTLSPEETKRFNLHYNFPPYSVGEVRRMGGPGRREVGHGMLAERALTPVIPDEVDFPYTLRLVCEALSSNGSTSMGSVCAGTLALMDAGVPIKKPVAGISVGLIADEDGRYVTFTDIQGLEDHLGDMDFKVAGTRDGITAIQLDIKAKNIGYDVIRDALEQAREARLFLLDRITETIGEARTEMSPYAPRMTRISIPVDKIGAVIGPGGKTIRGIVEATKATVDIQDDGTVVIGSSDATASDKAIQMVRDLTREIQVGEIFTGKVVKIASFGAFVALTPGKDGMVHISELADYHVPSVEDVVSLGEEITVIVTDIDSMGRVKLSRRALLGSHESGDRESGARPDRERSEPSGAERGPSSRDSRPPYQRDQQGNDRRGGYRSQGPRQGGQRGGPRPPDRRPQR